MNLAVRTGWPVRVTSTTSTIPRPVVISTRRPARVALDHVQRHALAGQLDGMRVAQLVRREAPPDTRLGGEPAELDAHVRARPRPPASRAVDDAEQRPDRQLDAWVASAPSRSSGPDQAAASVGALVPGLRFLSSMLSIHAVWFGSREASAPHEKRMRRW
jgi:hypothetical protein